MRFESLFGIRVSLGETKQEFKKNNKNHQDFSDSSTNMCYYSARTDAICDTFADQAGGRQAEAMPVPEPACIELVEMSKGRRAGDG